MCWVHCCLISYLIGSLQNTCYTSSIASTSLISECMLASHRELSDFCGFQRIRLCAKFTAFLAKSSGFSLLMKGCGMHCGIADLVEYFLSNRALFDLAPTPLDMVTLSIGPFLQLLVAEPWLSKASFPKPHNNGTSTSKPWPCSQNPICVKFLRNYPDKSLRSVLLKMFNSFYR